MEVRRQRLDNGLRVAVVPIAGLQSAAVLLATVANNFLLLRFITPVFPQAEVIEASLISAFNFHRNTLVFLGAMAFGATNVLYFYALFKERHARTGDKFLPASA